MKKQLVVLSAAAMVAAAAVPALAFENEFHGMYRLRTNVTNFQEAGLSGFQAVGAAAVVGPPALAAIPAVTKNGALYSKDDRTFTTFEQRARIQYIAKASDDLKLVTFFEIDSSWGDSAYSNGRGAGTGAGGDTVNIETKNVFLEFLIPSTPVRMKVGLQGWSDAYKGIIYNNDLAGAVATAKLDAFTATGAFFRVYDEGGTTTLGKKNTDLYALDGKFALNKDTTLGASYYMYYNDNTSRATTSTATIGNEIATTHTFGLNAATKMGIVGLDAFVLYQTGDALYDFQTAGADAGKTKDLSAWAAQIAANANLGMATVRGAFLYTSGDDGDKSDESGAFQVVQENVNNASPATFTGQGGNYYSSGMLLLFRNVFNMDSDQAVIANLNNGNHGVMAGVLGADFKVNDKFSIAANVGAGWNAEERGTETEDFLGTEVNLNLNYKLYPNLTATLQGAYFMLGDYFDDRVVTARNAATQAVTATTDPEDPYLLGLMLNYTF